MASDDTTPVFKSAATSGKLAKAQRQQLPDAARVRLDSLSVMVLIDPSSLLADVAADAPCGSNLEYDPAFIAVERAVRAAPQERLVGPNAVVEEPKWATIVEQAAELLGRSKDLRIAGVLTKALLRSQGLAGLRVGVETLRGLVEKHWDRIFPLLDPENDNDPTERINALRELTDRREVVAVLRMLPLAEALPIGRVSLRDIAQASEAQPSAANDAGASSLDAAKIDAIFMRVGLDKLRSTLDDVRQIREDLHAIANWVTDRVGAQSALSFEELNAVLEQMERVLVPRLSARTAEPVSAAAAAAIAELPLTAATMSVTQPGVIETRADVRRMLELLCAYYDEHEPSSPVPLLLRRAQRLTGMSFMDIMRDLAPSAESEVEKIRGPVAQDGNGST